MVLAFFWLFTYTYYVYTCFQIKFLPFLSEPRNVSTKHPIDCPTVRQFVSFVQGNNNIPVNRYQYLVANTDSLGKIRSSPNDPGRPTSHISKFLHRNHNKYLPLDFRTSSRLHDRLPIPNIGHDTKISERETFTF